jgi:predicted RNA-binding protein YlxR (DUF448 family)
MVKERMCCVCRTRKKATELIRVAREKQAEGYRYFVDRAGNANGRGCYLCPECVEKATKTRALNRSFKTNIPNEVYEMLITIN